MNLKRAGNCLPGAKTLHTSNYNKGRSLKRARIGYLHLLVGHSGKSSLLSKNAEMHWSIRLQFALSMNGGKLYQPGSGRNAISPAVHTR